MHIEKLILRELLESDRELYLLAASQEPGCEHLYSDNSSANLMWSLAYGEKGKRKNYVIENEDGVFIGFCNVEKGETPEIGINLLPAYQGKGIGANVVKLLWKKISQERELKYFIARVEEKNTRSIKMFEKIGAIPMEPGESDIIKGLRELVLVDKSFENILIGMKNFQKQIRQYSWSIENLEDREKVYGIK